MALKVSVVTFCVHLRHRQVASADPRALCHPDRIYQLQAAMYSTISLFSGGLEGAGLCSTDTQMNVSTLVVQKTSYSVSCALN